MNPAQAILVFLVQLYRWTLSPLKTAILGPHARCRFTPSCSAYALEALRQHGALRGAWLAARRIGRCQPWGGYGEDPVPRPAASSKGSPSRRDASTKAVDGHSAKRSAPPVVTVATVIH